MRYVLLVSGNPRNGKSPLATMLRDKHRFKVITIDDEYVRWIKSRYPTLYFKDLSKYIFQHYHYIVAGDYSKGVFNRDLVAEWHAHLLAHIVKRSQTSSRLVVEGYLLLDCKDAYEQELTKQGIQVVQILAENYLYSARSQRLPAEQLITHLALK